MSDTVWLSRAMGHASNLRPMTYKLSLDEDSEARSISIRKMNEEGDPLPQDCFPAEIFGAANAEEADYKLPDLFFADSYWVVSTKAANVLIKFDLGNGSLYPVDVFKKDRQTVIGDGWFCINFGNRKSALLPEQSVGIRKRAQNRYRVVGVPKDREISVSSISAMAGSDIWIEAQMWDGLFLSGALAQALKKSKADKGFFLSECRMIAG